MLGEETVIVFTHAYWHILFSNRSSISSPSNFIGCVTGLLRILVTQPWPKLELKLGLSFLILAQLLCQQVNEVSLLSVLLLFISDAKILKLDHGGWDEK